MHGFNQPAQGILAVVALLAAFIPLPAAEYILTDLGTGNGTDSFPKALNGTGQAVGWLSIAREDHSTSTAFLYSGGQMVELGQLAGGNNSKATGINILGDIVGSGDTTGGETHAFLSSNGHLTDLGTPGGDFSAATAINDAGQIVGYGNTTTGRNLHAFVYDDGRFTDLGIIPVTLDSVGRAEAINNSGVIVGGGGDSLEYNGAIWINGSLDKTLSREPLWAINDLGQCVGQRIIPGSILAAVRPQVSVASGGSSSSPLPPSGDGGGVETIFYADGKVAILSALHGGYAEAINDNGIIVGRFGWSGDNQTRAFIYARGKMTNLNSLKITGAERWTLVDAVAINNYNQILVEGVNGQGRHHALLLTPTHASAGVLAPPAFAKAAVDIFVVQGKPARFTITATGSGPFHYQWQASSDGGETWSDIVNGNGVTGATTANLALARPSSQWNGHLYRCIVNNTTDVSVIGDPAKLSIGLPPSIITAPIAQSIGQNNDAILSVTANGSAPLAYTWLKGKIVLSGETNSTLTLHNVQPADAATYTVTVTNAFGSATAKATLTVKPLPAFTTQPANQAIIAGQNAAFTIAVIKGKVAPTYQWQFSTDDGSTWSNLNNDATFTGTTTAKLAVVRALPSLDGEQFRCLVSNGAGPNPSHPATLTVTPPLDLSTWTRRTSDIDISPGKGSFNSVVWSGTFFIGVGINDGEGGAPVIQTSPDGVAWTHRSSLGHNSLEDIAWNGSLVVAVGGGGLIMTSPNGIDWTPRTSPTTYTLAGVCWTGSQFVAVGGSSAIKKPLGVVLASPDGITWKVKASPATLGFNNVATNGKVLVGVGVNFNAKTNALACAIASSSNAAAWTSRLNGPSGLMFGITWNGSLFVAVGDGGAIYTSPDGIKWTARASGTAKRLLNVAWFGSQFVAVGADGTILASPDGLTWTAHSLSTLDDFTGLAWNGRRVVVVGLNDEIRTADPGAP